MELVELVELVVSRPRAAFVLAVLCPFFLAGEVDLGEEVVLVCHS